MRRNTHTNYARSMVMLAKNDISNFLLKFVCEVSLFKQLSTY